MTDKQIIIDGVDVSGCINFRPDVDTAQISYTNACSIGIWQRWYSNLEPSCIMSCSCKYNPNCYYKQLKRKEQECEELKDTFDGLLKVQYQLADNNKKLRQCLTEIKEIMKKHCRKCKKHKFYHFQLCCTCKYTDILQKINEVLNA